MCLPNPASTESLLVGETVTIAGVKADNSKAIEKIQMMGGKDMRSNKLTDRPVIEVNLKQNKKFN